MKITIAEPVLINPLEQFKPMLANETRAVLAELFLPHDGDNTVTEPLSKEYLKTLKELVQGLCKAQMFGMGHAAVPEHTMLRVLSAAATAADFSDNREGSYRVEFAFQWARKYLFSNKLPMPDVCPANTFGALSYPYQTCGYMDGALIECGVKQTAIIPNMRDAVPTMLVDLTHVSNSQLSGELPYDGQIRVTEIRRTGGMCGVVYTEEDTAWFAGFLTADDVLKLRFRRMRLGAAVKELTGDDERARIAADMRDLSSWDFVLHPNDRPFGAEYVRMAKESVDLGSCMSRSAGKYSAPFSVHPCDVYSCAHYGQGDNGLVLVEAQQGGTPVGRGILNIYTKQIVRWYGEYKASVLLHNTFGIDIDTDALDDVQLALIQDGNEIAAPYLDGGDNAEVRGGQLFVDITGAIEMQDTCGYAYLCETAECVLSEQNYPVSEMLWQDSTETWYHPDNVSDGVLCPILGEYVPDYRASWSRVDGEEALISDYILGRPSRAEMYGWEFLGGNIGFTKDVDQYTYDDVTGEYYTNDDYAELVAEREAEQEVENNEAA